MSLALQRPAVAMLRTAWQWRRNDGSLWAARLYALLLAVLLGVPAVAALLWMPQRAAWISVGVLALMALCIVWSLHFAAMLRLDHPHAAHTVPGHARALRTAALGLWAALVGLSAVVAAVGAAGLGVGDIATCWRFGLAAALGTGTLLFFVAAAMRWWGLWLLAGLGPSFMGPHVWRTAAFEQWDRVLPLWQAQPLGITLVVLLAQGLLLCTVFGTGNAAHARAYARRKNSRRMFALAASGQKPALAAYGRWGEWLNLPGQKLVDAWLQRCLARARARPASVMARAELVLHDGQHWVRQLWVLLCVQLCVGLLIALTATLTGAGIPLFLEHGSLGISIGVGVMAFGAVLNLPSALWVSRREQALLMLLPGMPQGATLNRALAWRQWRHCLLLWLGLLPALFAVVWVGQASYALAFMGMALLLSAWLWRDHARMTPARRAAPFLPVLMLGPLVLLSALLLNRHPGALWFWALGVLGLTAALLAWRWRALAHLPQALPVGRLA